MRALVTGGCGFVGHHVVEHLLKNTGWDVVVLDRLNYASAGFDRLRDIEAFDDRRVTVLTADFTQPIVDGLAQEIGNVEYVLHLGAETHVDRSIEDAEPFVMSNVVGTMRLLDFARTLPSLRRMIYFSTDEVFGPAGADYFFKEWDRYNCTNPYAATKAGGEELVLAYANTHGVPAIVTHSMNIFGERQHPEKFIPMCIRKARDGERVTIHADPTRTQSGSRCWIHARNVADALLFLLDRGGQREKYNIVGEELSNLRMAQLIAAAMDTDLHCEMVDFHSSRPGHDLRYALDGTRMREMGWRAPRNLRESLRKMVRWYLAHPRWLNWTDAGA